MVESALAHIRILEDLNYQNIKVSLKASDIDRTVAAYRMLAGQVDYPLHIGITEAGTTWAGTIKSAIGLGALLYDGIGDTLRVSLTGDPVEEVHSLPRVVVLREHDLDHIPILTVANKIDLVDPETVRWLTKHYQAIPISARRAKTLPPLLESIRKTLKSKASGQDFNHSQKYFYPEPSQGKPESQKADQQKSFSPA
jgi:4-hydroxy-3-methylbut-2-en-1-yl diphosphate synthase IspG/GcpE